MLNISLPCPFRRTQAPTSLGIFYSGTPIMQWSPTKSSLVPTHGFQCQTNTSLFSHSFVMLVLFSWFGVGSIPFRLISLIFTVILVCCCYRLLFYGIDALINGSKCMSMPRWRWGRGLQPDSCLWVNSPSRKTRAPFCTILFIQGLYL